MKAINHIISECGGTSKLAAALNIQAVTVRVWRRNGFPMRHAQKVHEVFNISLALMDAAQDPSAEFHDPATALQDAA